MEDIIKKKPLEERIKEFMQLKNIYPTKIPIIIDCHPQFPNLKKPKKNKFLIEDYNLKDFYSLFANNYLELSMTENDSFLEIKLYATQNYSEILIETTLKEIYEKYKEEDGFLYLKYSYEYKNIEKQKLKENNIGEIILKSYPDKIPILLKKNPNYDDNIEIAKNQFLIPKKFKIEQFINFLAKNYLNEKFLQNPNININIMTISDNATLKSNQILSDIYNKYKDKKDGLLYLYYFYTYNKSEKMPLKEMIDFSSKNWFKDKIPIIIEKDPNYPRIKDPLKYKFLLDKSFTVKSFSKYILSNHLNMNSSFESSNFNFFLKTKSDYNQLNNDDILAKIYEDKKDEDNFLYLYYSYEDININDFHLKSINEKKKESCKILKENPSKIPLIIENDPKFQYNKKISQNLLIIEKNMKIFELSDMVKNILELKSNIGNTRLHLILSNSSKNIKLSSNEKIEEIYNRYKNVDGFIYLLYSYKYVKDNNLPIMQPKNKKNNEIQKIKKELSKFNNQGKIPIIVERYPLSLMKDFSKKYLLPQDIKLEELQLLISKNIFDLYKDVNIKYCLITEKNIELSNQEKIIIKDIYKMYKSEDDCLYLYYIEPSLLPESKMFNEEIFLFKKKYSLEERKKKYQELKAKNPSKILIIVEKEATNYNNNSEDEKIDEIFLLEPKEEIDSLKMKIWKKIGKPFLKIELKNSKKNIILYLSKIFDLYNKFKDNEDGFLYLFYRCITPNLKDKEYQNEENMKEAKKIFLLFKRIPFIFKPSPSFANSNSKTKVFLPYGSNLSTFKEIETDKKYKYYIEYPNKIVDLNEKLVDYYLKNKNEKDDYLHLIIEKE